MGVPENPKDFDLTERDIQRVARIMFELGLADDQMEVLALAVKLWVEQAKPEIRPLWDKIARSIADGAAKWPTE